MTQQSKFIFLAIIVLALGVIGVTWLVERVNLYTLPTREIEPVLLKVAAAPDLAGWLRSRAEAFNERQGDIIVSITPVDSARASSVVEGAGAALPDVWIPEADFVLFLYQTAPFEASGSPLAGQSLLWVDPAGAGGVDWPDVHDTVQRDFQFQLALPPRKSIGRLAACASAAAGFKGDPALSYGDVTGRTFQQWMGEIEEAIPNPGRNPVDQLTTRPVTIDIGLVLSAQARGLPAGYARSTPRFQVTLSYPYLVRTRWVELDVEGAAARAAAAADFQTFLLGGESQTALEAAGFSLNPAEGGTTTGVAMTADVVRGLQWCWE